MYKAQTNHLIYMDECKVHEKELDRVRKEIMKVLNRYEIRDYNEKIERGLRTFVLRGFNGEYQCTLVTGRMTLSPAMIEDCLKIKGVVSIYQNIQISQKQYEVFSNEFVHLGGKKKLLLEIDGIKLHLSPASFFQLNLDQAKVLYKKVVELIEPCDFLVEAYSGVGAISLFASSKAKRVLGIENNLSAVKNAKENARMNHCDHVDFLCGDAAKVLREKLSEKVDCLVVDPPRSGLDDAMIETIIKAKPKQIIYISCNPATLGKNLSQLSKRYEVERVIPLDMFPQTPHVETVVLLSRIKG
ncbi:MAG: 23S rRNA (uracil(1939)-C(5))-methyltransferase RlmD, partial [Anaerorhabdus sp.]